MVNYNMYAGWMAFDALTVSDGLECSYTLGYKLTDKTDEKWTARFSKFKNGDTQSEWGAATALHTAVPKLIEELKFDPKRTAFISALSSSETSANPDRSICWLTKNCAELCEVQYIPDALSKNAHTKIHTIFTASDRTAELDKAQYKCLKIDADHVFIFDDIITRGDTLSRIATAVLAINPNCKVYGIALAKAERVAFCPNPDNDQVFAKWGNLWEQGEAEYARKYKKG